MLPPQCVLPLLLLSLYGGSNLWASPEAVEYRYRVTPEVGSPRGETRRVVCRTNSNTLTYSGSVGEGGIMMEVETIVIDGRRIEAIRVRIQAEGLLSLFWNQPFWFRASDGVLVRYHTIEGSLGEIDVVVELIGTGS